MSSITPNHFYDFALAFLGDRVMGTRRESSHFFIKAHGLQRPMLIDTNFDFLPDRILNSQLRLLGIDRSTFDALAGTKQLLKQYIRSQKNQEQPGTALVADP